jgi:DNA-binding protein HU-beta
MTDPVTSGPPPDRGARYGTVSPSQFTQITTRENHSSRQNVHNSASFGKNGHMNKRDLAKAVAVQADIELKTVALVLDGFTEVVTAVVSKGEPVSIPGFAKFVKVDRAARMGRNPATGEAIRIKASKKARITPVKAFKDAVLAPSTAPKLKKGAFPIDNAAVAAAGKSPAVAPVRATVAKAPAKKAPVAKKTAVRRAPAKKAVKRAR